MNERKKHVYILAISMIFIFVGLFLPGLANASDFGASYDFGAVALGSSSNATVSIASNTTEEVVLRAFRLESGSDFKVVTEISNSGIPLAPGQVVSIEIAYIPKTPGSVNDVLYIYTNSPLIIGTVELSGTGLEQKTEITIEEILDYFDSSVNSGLLIGNDSGKLENDQLYAYHGNEPNKKDQAADNRLKALRNMLKSAANMISEEDLNGACEQLLDVYKKADGQGSPESPPDFITGVATGQLATMIADYRQQLNCR